MFTVGAFAIIVNAQQHILLCHRRDMDRWNLPGGGVMHGETPWKAVMREVQEEVGLITRVERLIGVYAYPPRNDLVCSFFCTITGGELAKSDEADRIAYFPVDQLPTTNMCIMHYVSKTLQRIENRCFLPHFLFCQPRKFLLHLSRCDS
jgi:8-oxo-dGTP diphosphatase